MALKNFRPLTPTQRFKQTSGFDEITKIGQRNLCLSQKSGQVVGTTMAV